MVGDESFSWSIDVGGGGDCGLERVEDSYRDVCMGGVWVGSDGAGVGGLALETRD